MNILIQLICIIVSFLYGVFINLFIRFNKRVIINSNLLYEIIYRLITTFLLVVLYIVIIYKINNGIFHEYFLITMLLGYVIYNKRVKSF